MDYLKGIIDVDVVFKTFKDGLVMFKHAVGLDILEAERVGRMEGDVQQKKKEKITYSGKKEYFGQDNDSVLKAHGERFQPRKITKVTALGTIYGQAQPVIMNIREHCYSGMNKLYITEDGLPNDTAIIKRLRELGVTSDTKEARYGLLFNTVFNNDYYDNATPLFVHLLLRLAVLGMYERNTRYNSLIKIPKPKVVKLMGYGEDQIETMLVHLVAEECKMSLSRNDKHVLNILQAMDDWLQANPHEGDVFEYRVQVWHMYNYDDGHSKSGRNFGKHFGFTHNKHIVPLNLFHTGGEESLITKPVPGGLLSTDDTVKMFGSSKGYLNCSGMTDRQVRILNHLLQGSKRTTPFLADQTIDFGFKDRHIYCYGIPRVSGEEEAYGIRDVRNIMNLLINNHRYHECFSEAAKLVRYWIAQPATETVESHWCTHVNRALVLPEIGLKRAAIHILTEGQGVCIKQSSIIEAREAMRQNDRLLVESLFANTCWYWGEYLTVYNALDLDDLYMKVTGEQDQSVKAVYRPEVIISSMIGRAVPRCSNKDIGTMLRMDITDYKQLKVPFGTINIQHIEEYGYRLEDEKIILGSLVPPSCVGLIVGMAGSLLNNTPYSSLFSTNPATRKGGRMIRGTGLNYNDLWAHGVVNRWQGYDLDYTHPLKNGRHTIYAANDVQIAMPPVNPLTCEVPLSYTVKRIEERERCFGSSTERMLDCKLLFSWQRYGPQALETADYGADTCSKVVTNNTILRSFDIVTSDSEEFVVAIKSNYILQTSDFQVVEVMAGVPLPVDTDIYPSLEEEEPLEEMETSSDTGEKT